MMIQKTTNRDTIIDEIHQTRQRMADKFGYDIVAILDDARNRQLVSGHAIWQASTSNNLSIPMANKQLSQVGPETKIARADEIATD